MRVYYKTRIGSDRLDYTRPARGEIESGENTAEYPDRPADRNGYEWHLYEKTRGVLEWREDVLPPEPLPEPAPSKAEQEAHRAEAYRERVDPLTAEITRKESDLARGIVPEEDEQKVRERIDEAYAERDAAVKAIDEEFPYPASADDADKTAQEQPLPTL